MSAPPNPTDEPDLLLSEANATIKALQAALAAERSKPKTTEYAQGWDDHVLAAKSQRETLEAQLAAAVEALKEAAPAIAREHPVHKIIDAAFAKIGVTNVRQ